VRPCSRTTPSPSGATSASSISTPYTAVPRPAACKRRRTTRRRQTEEQGDREYNCGCPFAA
jgi:hypothetical protein